ncbi:hypothetical protein C1878_08465 [Gordonibacter sp. 28C]|uniref:hypothetical protein n=1 Tax=Gordonibacter sp. 28C TaxID=2078569 RepID=UPI000DF7DD47|nr:hypothetical protein [Gordonibacter sp. 28C]RDB62345.1 hypothetical protein C1878_08465 [Gordonibacter sp. 28C]
MRDQNLFAVFIEPLSEPGLESLRNLDGSDVLVVGAVGRGGDDRDMGIVAGIGPTGFPVEDESKFADVLGHVGADVLVDCAGDLRRTASLLKSGLRLGVPALVWVPPCGFESNDFVELGELDEAALEGGAPVAFFEDPKDIQTGISVALAGPSGIVPFQLY